MLAQPYSIADAFGPAEHIVVYPGDCLDLLRTIPAKTLQLVVTSPPYNIGKEYEKKLALDRYLEQQAQVIRECVRALSPAGSICWQVGNYFVCPSSSGSNQDSGQRRLHQSRSLASCRDIQPFLTETAMNASIYEVSSMARRKPRPSPRWSGATQLRHDDRQRDAPPLQLPPRATRNEPPAGPRGSSAGDEL
jgi:hypothetical protein